ncbi:MAG: alpha/beta hydrolase [Gemmatimonadota bacterium]|nr:alpha/beta hydrolase [Gemmatimonadota bacterium]
MARHRPRLMLPSPGDPWGEPTAGREQGGHHAIRRGQRYLPVYEEQRQGEPLLLHGALGAADPAVTSDWSLLLPALAARYRTFSLEFRAHGRIDNAAGRLSYAQMADDVAAFIELLRLTPAHLAGFSDGATISLVLGMTRPAVLRSLVCVGANYCVDDHLRRGMELFDAAAIERESPEFAAELARRHDAHHHPGYWRDRFLIAPETQRRPA